MQRPAIVVPAFSRPLALQRLLRSLNRANYPVEGVRLVISVDGGAAEEVTRIAREFQFASGPKEVIVRERNMGLRDHLLWCGDQTARYGSVIVLEDDLFVDPHFYWFACGGLDAYGGDERIAGVALYAPRYNEFARLPFEPCFDGTSAYFACTPCSSGQAWTESQWVGFRRWLLETGFAEGQDDSCLPAEVRAWPKSSWKKLFATYLAQEHRYFVYPYQSYTTNFSDAGGTHIPCGTNLHQVPMALPGRPPQQLQFRPLADAVVRYDAFMEPQSDWMEQWLGLEEGSLCVDLYAQRDVCRLQSRPLSLTSRPTRRAIRRFGLSLRPIELNMCHEEDPEYPFFSLASSADVLPERMSSRTQLHTYFAYSPIYSRDFLGAVATGLASGQGMAALRAKVAQLRRRS